MNRLVFFLALSAIVFFSLNAFAAGYELLEQSAEAVGSASAGSATGFGDGSEVFYNPAALTDLKDGTASAGLHFIIPHAEFIDKGSRLSSNTTSPHLSGNLGGNAGGLNLVPNLYFTSKASEDLSFGIGINSPFGLSTEYNDTWIGRYHANKSSLKTVNINPAVGLKLSEDFAIGTSMQIIYSDAEISNAIDFGSIGTSLLGSDVASKLGLRPQQSDGSVVVKADDWGLGLGLGASYSPSDNIKLGLNWRSRVQLQLEGDADFSLPQSATVLNSSGLFNDSAAGAHITLPESLNFGAAVELDSEWTILSDVTWIGWDRFEELRVSFDSALPDSVQDEKWDNTWRYSFGAKYKANDLWNFRMGVTYDQTPIVDAEYRTPRIPDNDRFWTAIGANYALTADTTLAFAYAHLFVSDADSEVTNSSGALLSGDWDLSVEVVSLNLLTHF